MRRFVFVLSTAMLLACCVCGRAEPLDHDWISAEAKWLVHIDLDALGSVKTIAPLRREWLARESVQAEIQKVVAALGTNVTEDLHSVTVSGREYTPDSGVVMLRAKSDPDKVLALIRKKENHQTSRHNAHELHSWLEEEGSEQTTFTGCFYRPTVIVFGRSDTEVKAVLDVLDGKRAALAGIDSPLAAKPPQGTIIQVRATGLADVDIPFKSPLIRPTEFVSLALGEQEGDVFLEGESAFESVDVATEMETIANGFLALAKLQTRDAPDVAKILDALKVTRQENRLRVQWRGKGEELLAGVMKMQKQSQEGPDN